MDDNDGGCKRFILVDDEYKLFFDHQLSGDNSFLPPFDEDNGETETRNLGFKFSTDSKRSKLSGTEEKPIKNRVSQQRKRKDIGYEAEVSRAFPFATTRESIQRDNRASERRKRKMAEFESARVSRAVPLVNIQRDNKAKIVSESTKVNTFRDVSLVRATQRDNKARKVPKVNTLRDVPLVKAKEVIQRDNKARKVSESTKVDTLRDVPLVRAKGTIQRDTKAKKVSSESTKVNTSRDVPLVRAKKDYETKAAETSRVVNVKQVNRVTNPKAVDKTSPRFVPVEGVNRVKAVDKTPKFVPVKQSKGVSVGTRKKNKEENVMDKDYMSYLTWLVDSLKDSTTPTQKKSTMAPEKDHLTKVKVELETESCSDSDDDIIMVSDSPFLSGDSTPFVVSKSKTVIDLEKDSTEDETISCLFTKELMDVLEKPYDQEELLRLYGEVSEKKQVTRCRELRKGRESNYETSEFGPSYLEKVSDFDKEYRRVDGDDDDEERLKLLRGFFFYLKNVTRAGSFKPWLPENQKKLGLRKQCLQPIRRGSKYFG